MKRNSIRQISINKKRLSGPILSLTITLLLLSTFSAALSVIDRGSSLTAATLSESIEVYSDYTLTENLFFESGHGFIIKSNGVNIDGTGYKITGNKNVASCEFITATDPAAETAAHGILNSGYDDVTIKNLEIENFATGIYLHGTGQNNVENNRIENCIIHDNGLSDMSTSQTDSVTHGIHMVFTKNSVVFNSDIYANEGTGTGCEAGGNGIYIYGGDKNPDQIVIDTNELYHNAKAGIWIKQQLDYSTISRNHIWGNGNGEGITDSTRGGIVFRCKSTNYNTIQQNTVEDNKGDGIFVGGNNNDFHDNIILSNNDNGVNLARSDGSKNNYMQGNTICTNANYDVFNVYDSFGGGNTGNENTGDTASNYRDEGTSGNVYFTYSCSGGNNAPTAPSITGPSSNLKKDISYEYTFVASDPDGDQIYYCINWGDGSIEVCIGPFISNEPQKLSHSWPKSDTTYVITATAKDIHGLEGPEGQLSIKTPRNTMLGFSFFEKVFFSRNFQTLEQILQILCDID